MGGGLRTDLDFWSRVNKTASCWLWTGATVKGYGYLKVPPSPRRTMYAHRVVWCLRYGQPPNGMCILHRCDNPLCVNPDHLFLGTHADNMRDASAKGRAKNQNSNKTHCKRGHELSNESRYKDGRRYCRECKQEWHKRNRPSQKGVADA